MLAMETSIAIRCNVEGAWVMDVVRVGKELRMRNHMKKEEKDIPASYCA
jgi:hypothetical protein